MCFPLYQHVTQLYWHRTLTLIKDKQKRCQLLDLKRKDSTQSVKDFLNHVHSILLILAVDERSPHGDI